jgi:hypothetical protein
LHEALWAADIVELLTVNIEQLAVVGAGRAQDPGSVDRAAGVDVEAAGLG